MGIAERKQKEKEKLRRKILNTAKDILIEKGLSKLTMRAVAERIDYSPTTIYLYFKNKEEILQSILEQHVNANVLVTEKLISGTQSADQKVKALLEGFVDSMDNHHYPPGLYLEILAALLRTVRPRQWLKNLALFAALVFSGLLFEPKMLEIAMEAAVAFCLLSSGVYIMNDLVDINLVYHTWTA